MTELNEQSLSQRFVSEFQWFFAEKCWVSDAARSDRPARTLPSRKSSTRLKFEQIYISAMLVAADCRHMASLASGCPAIQRSNCRKNHFFNMWRDMDVYGPISPSAQGPPYQPKKSPFEPCRVWLGMTLVWGYISTYRGMPWNTSVDRHFNQCFEKHYPMPLHCFLRCY